MFNLFFAGMGSKGTNAVKRELGCNQLLSQLNERKAIMEWVTYLREHPECKSRLFIDSGAFSAHTKGKVVDVDEYIKFINDIDDCVFVFAQVDKIPGEFRKEKTAEQLASAPKESWDNYLYMVDKVKSRDKLLPVFHQGEDFKWLENMLEYRHPDGKPIDYIGVSPANDVHSQAKKEWLDRVFRTIKNSSNPNVKTHAFGMTSLDLLELYPLTSADSTTWVIWAAYGLIFTKYGSVTVSDYKNTKSSNLNNRTPEETEAFNEYLKSLGTDIQTLTESTEERSLHNLRYLKNWADNYKFSNVKSNKKSLI